MTLHLTQSWTAAPAGSNGTLTVTLLNLGSDALLPVSVSYTSLARIDEETDVRGGTIVQNEGSFVQLVPDAGIPANGNWSVTVRGLAYRPATRAQGVLSAWITLKSGATIEATIGDLEPVDGVDPGPGKIWPEGEVSVPLALLPWPVICAVDDWTDAPMLCPASESDAVQFQTVAALHRRLFPTDPAPLSVTPTVGARPVAFKTGDVPKGGYRLDFGAKITVTHGDADGQRHGLIALAQIAHGTRTDRRFRFPAAGYIEDAPRFEWRGMMLDVVRNFFDVPVVLRTLDILAWLRMNRLHWHLTDDEAWRMPSKAFPALNNPGATRGPDMAMPPQYGDGPTGQSGYYTPADIAQVVGHAATLGIDVMPEVEMPGHAKALISSVPGLRDVDEPNGCYRSIQGHTNNALNPGLPHTYAVAETLLDEATALFPFDVVHVGADEVEVTAWQNSPAAKTFAHENDLRSTHAMQAYFLRHVQAHLATKTRKIGAWDEAAMGGGIAPDTALLFAWRTKERIAELIAAGYDVVATPGQAYYLDMVEAPGWDAYGISWAGVASPQTTYDYEPGDELPDGPGRLVGVQAAIWTEYLRTPAAINAMAFPRLAAVAEAAWTPQHAKSWPRFCALSRLVPQL